jgi:putative acetyltransferase
MCGACDHVFVIVRPQEPRDYEAAKVVYAEAFKRQDHGDRVPLEVGIFAALWEAKDVIDELSFTALAQNAVVGHVTASRAKVGFDPVVAVGPIGVLPDHQAKGIGSALMNALLSAADAQDVPLVVLLGSPQYYGRFGFRSAAELGVVAPEPKWGNAFQARPLRASTPSVAGTIPVRTRLFVLDHVRVIPEHWPRPQSSRSAGRRDRSTAEAVTRSG